MAINKQGIQTAAFPAYIYLAVTYDQAVLISYF